jgi:hypothetical protein
LDRDCAGCQGCAYLGQVAKEFALALESPPAEDRALGRLSDTVRRCEVVYAKEGPARFVSHNDLVSTLQRVFRRAGIEASHSAGFHPKMQMSFPPALPLGMSGGAELFEFRTPREIPPPEFLARTNAAAPEA